MGKLQHFFEGKVGKFTEIMTNITLLQSLMDGFILVMPISLGVILIVIFGNLPIPVWMHFLQTTGLYQVAQDFISLTMSLMGIYMVTAIGYAHAKNLREKNPVIVAIIATVSFVVLQPIQQTATGATALLTSGLGSDGMFVALLMGLMVPSAYHRLMKTKMAIKLPDTVPPNVTASLTPTFAVIIIFTVLFFVKFAFTLTAYGDIFTAMTTVIQSPLMHLGTSPWTVLFVEVFAAFLWFFGIHPNTVNSVIFTIAAATGPANIEAFQKGLPLPYLAFVIVFGMCTIGGQGNTLGLCLNTFTAKSGKYVAMRKVVTPAVLLNVNEPIIFGFPLMLNPIYFVPMILTTLVNGIIAITYLNFIIPPVNPTISLPWVIPQFVSTFITGGAWLLLLWVLCVAADVIIYHPFFRLDDRRTLKQEGSTQQ